MAIFLALAGVLAWLFGAALLIMPGSFYAPTGIEMTPLMATVAQAHGATLIGLGTINFFGRRAAGSGLLAILAGNLVVQIASLVVVIRTMTLGPGSKVAPGIAIHLVLGALFAFFLLRAQRATPTSQGATD